MARVAARDDGDLATALGAVSAAGRQGHAPSLPPTHPAPVPAHDEGPRDLLFGQVTGPFDPVWRRQDSNLGRLSRQIYSLRVKHTLTFVCGTKDTASPHTRPTVTQMGGPSL